MVLLLAIVFISPVFLALLIHQNPHLLGQPANKGQWVAEPVKIDELKQGQYGFIYIMENACDSLCEQRLDKLARTRLALGRRLYQVDLIALTPINLTMDANQKERLQALGYKIVMLKPLSPLNQGDIYLANPQQEIMLHYPAPLNAKDIFSDVQRLLKQAES